MYVALTWQRDDLRWWRWAHDWFVQSNVFIMKYIMILDYHTAENGKHREKAICVFAYNMGLETSSIRIKICRGRVFSRKFRHRSDEQRPTYKPFLLKSFFKTYVTVFAAWKYLCSLNRESDGKERWKKCGEKKEWKERRKKPIFYESIFERWHKQSYYSP